MGSEKFPTQEAGGSGLDARQASTVTSHKTMRRSSALHQGQLLKVSQSHTRQGIPRDPELERWMQEDPQIQGKIFLSQKKKCRLSHLVSLVGNIHRLLSHSEQRLSAPAVH